MRRRAYDRSAGVSPLVGLDGRGDSTISATAYQKKRRELQEQTSVAARLNETGPGDPYAKVDANYDQAGVKDQGYNHQELNQPPPYSLTPHAPEKLHDPVGKDEGTMHQEGNPSPSSVEIRKDEADKLGGEGDEFSDQRVYAALDKRDASYTTASEDNVSLAGPEDAEADVEADGLDGKSVKELRDIARAEEVEDYAELRKPALRDAIRAGRKG